MLLQDILCALTGRTAWHLGFWSGRLSQASVALHYSPDWYRRHAHVWSRQVGLTPWETNRSSPMEQAKVLKQEFIPSARERLDSPLKACIIPERHVFQCG